MMAMLHCKFAKSWPHDASRKMKQVPFDPDAKKMVSVVVMYDIKLGDYSLSDITKSRLVFQGNRFCIEA